MDFDVPRFEFCSLSEKGHPGLLSDLRGKNDFVA
jgi:hypothetical protein